MPGRPVRSIVLTTCLAVIAATIAADRDDSATSLPATAPPAGSETPATARHDCEAGTTIYQEIALTSGVQTQKANVVTPLAPIKIPVGRNGAQYGDCLQREGLVHDLRDDPYLARAETCRRRSARQIAVPSGRIGGTIDEANFAICMQGGPNRTINVETLPK